MRAGYYEKVGPAAEVLTVGDLPTPTPGPGEVLVRVATSGVNPSDVKSRAGARRGMPYPRVIPHSDGAGTIEAVGEGVDAGRVGQRVWLWNAAFGRADGSNAEYVALPAAQAVSLPDRASFAEGACLGIPALTAHRCVFADGPVQDLDVLVTGGAGAVGAYAIQMAKLGGARVIATVSSPEKAAHARAMGADHVIDYRLEDVVSGIKAITNGGGVDRIVEVELGGNLPATLQVLKINGVVAAYGSMAVPEPVLPVYPLLFAGQTIRTVLVYILPAAARAQAEADLTRWLADGALRHPISARFPLAQSVAAHQQVESGKRLGATIIEMPGAA